MELNPFIAALRTDRGPQRQAQTAMDAARTAWRAEPGGEQLAEELYRYGKGAPLEMCPLLEAMFTEVGEAERLIALLVRHYCAALKANPIGHPPFRHGFDGAAGTLLLARSGRVQLMIQAREPGRLDHRTYTFSDASRFDAVLAGEGQARIVRARPAGGTAVQFDREALSLRGGERIALDSASETLVVDSVERRLVVLRLMRSAAEPEPGREYDAQSGALLSQSAGTIATSRQEMIVALLGRMGRSDAAPEMAWLATGEGDRSLRWQALRECLALDSAEGFAALGNMARAANDPLAANAGALRAQLLENYPEFAELGATGCRA
ncbi:MAG: hypothetical protein JY451_01580 [Erythrobacter sp.]|nr:MAG: hypothetical protein JY451_01580 [Erythrobacter sp.]